MLLIPHIRIARRVSGVLRERFQVRLSPVVFAFGSIFPDLAKNAVTGYHDINEAVSRVEGFLAKRPKSRLVQSFRLGEICHYTADSFCRVHIHHDQYTLKEHMLYEMRQSRQMKRLLPLAGKLAMEDVYPSRSGALARFFSEQREFAAQKHSYEEETNAVVRGCVLVLHSLAHQPWEEARPVALAQAGS